MSSNKIYRLYGYNYNCFINNNYNTFNWSDEYNRISLGNPRIFRYFNFILYLCSSIHLSNGLLIKLLNINKLRYEIKLND